MTIVLLESDIGERDGSEMERCLPAKLSSESRPRPFLGRKTQEFENFRSVNGKHTPADV